MLDHNQRAGGAACRMNQFRYDADRDTIMAALLQVQPAPT